LESKFALGYAEGLSDTLLTRLGAFGPKGYENCQKFIREDPQIEAMRAELTHRRRILDNAKDILEHFRDHD